RPDRLAVLVRSVADEGQGVAVALAERAIPYRVVGASAFFERAEIRDVLAWLRLLIDPRDNGAVVRALARPPIELNSIDIARRGPRTPGAAVDAARVRPLYRGDRRSRAWRGGGNVGEPARSRQRDVDRRGENARVRARLRHRPAFRPHARCPFRGGRADPERAAARVVAGRLAGRAHRNDAAPTPRGRDASAKRRRARVRRDIAPGCPAAAVA